jgi:DNA repair protein RadA/Sms
MAKSTKNYVCQSCGAVSSKWSGKCDSCNEWNSIVEEAVEAAVPKGMGTKKGRSLDLVNLSGQRHDRLSRLITGIAEFDRVTGVCAFDRW